MAAIVEAHFANNDPARRITAPVPTAKDIATLVDAAFWASLRRDEGIPTTISLATLAPEHSRHPLLLESPLPVVPEALTRLAPAVRRPGIHLGVWHNGGEPFVWGTTRSLPPCSFVLEVSAPGLLVVKESPAVESDKFINIAVLESDRISVITRESKLFGTNDGNRKDNLLEDIADLSVDIFLRLAISMRAHGRGGIVLVVPDGAEKWKQSIVHPVLYSVAPAFTGLSALLRDASPDHPSASPNSAIDDAVDLLAGLTAVDGATIVSRDCELLAFGAKIRRRDGSPSVEEVLVTEPVQGAQDQVRHPGELGGTRHLAAAQFVHDQRDAVALVASQDGRFTTFSWSHAHNVVHARRMELLLL